MPAGDSVFPENQASLDVLASLDVWIFGCVCEGGCCKAIRQKVHGRVYASGDSFQSWYPPTDPMRGGYYSTEDPWAGQKSLHIWRQWAEATE